VTKDLEIVDDSGDEFYATNIPIPFYIRLKLDNEKTKYRAKILDEAGNTRSFYTGVTERNFLELHVPVIPLRDKGKIKKGDKVLIIGASGSVGSAAVQIAKYFGATVITTTSTSRKIEMAMNLGADHAINYKQNKDYRNQVYELTNKHGIDIVIDNVGQATFPTSIRMLRPGGRLITCGVTSGPFSKINIADIFWKHLEIKGSTMANQGEFRDVMRLVLDGTLTPIIDKEYPLEEVREAEQYLSEGNQFGKILIKVS